MAQNPVVTTGAGDTPQVAFNKINTDIGTLYSNVDTASNSASAASASAASANTSATTAATNAANAVAAVAAAQAAANAASATATTAQSTATSAQSTANTANTNASTALTTANAIAATANTANTNATSAQTTAATAATNATNALNTANGVNTTAQSALTAANSAQTQAAAAVVTANAATTAVANVTTTVNAAQTSANAALTSANNAVTTANGIAATANSAVTSANTATTNAATALAAANTASTAASTAQTAANTASANATAAVNTANGIAATANTANTNASTALTNVGVSLTAANAAKYVAGVNKLALSQMYNAGLIASQVYPGQPVGGTSSQAGLQQAINYVSAQYRTNGIVYTLYIDAVYYIGILSDWTKTTFIEPNVSVEFAKGAYFITDNCCVPAFVFAYTYNVNALNWHISYQGTGTPLDNTLIAPGQSISYYACSSNFNNITLTNYMKVLGQSGAAPDGRVNITFTNGATALWPGPQPYGTQMFFTGSHDCEFINLRLDVPPDPPTYNALIAYSIGNVVNSAGIYYIATAATTGNAPPNATYWQLYTGASGQTPNPRVALPSQFIPYTVNGSRNWQPNQIVNASSYPSNLNITGTCASYRLSFINWVFDGTVMGWNGEGLNGSWKHGRSYRYADCQRYDGAFVGGWGTPDTWNSGRTYATGWVITYSGTLYVSLINSNTNNIPSATIGTDWAVYTTGTLGYPTQSPWCSPPHLYYLQDLDASYYAANPLFTARELSDTYDYGIAPGFQKGRRANSGTNMCLSLKIPISNDVVVDGYTSYRPDGGAALLCLQPNNLYGKLTNCYFSFNSLMPVCAEQQYINNGPFTGLAFPSSYPYVYMVLQNITLRDNATTSVQFPITNISNGNNANVSITGVKVYVNDFSGTQYPGFSLAGTNMEYEAQHFFQTYSATTSNVGILAQGSNILTQSKVKVEMLGFRGAPLYLTTAPLGTGGTLTTAYSNGGVTTNCALNFTSAEVRYGTLTNGSTAITWAIPLQNTPVAFTTAPSGTTGTLTAAMYAAAGPTSLGASGSIPVTMNTSQKVIMTWVGSAATFSATLTGTPTATGHIVTQNTNNYSAAGTLIQPSGVLQGYYSNLRNRISVMGTTNANGSFIGCGANNRIEVNDIINGYYQLSENGTLIERWSQMWVGTPTAGTSFTVPNIIIPSGMAVTRFTWYVTNCPLGTGNGLTGVNVGWSGSTSAITTGLLQGAALGITSGTNPANPPAAPVPAAGTQRNLLLTAVGGTGFDGTGIVTLTLVCEQQYCTT